jgi:hypothetical protein
MTCGRAVVAAAMAVAAGMACGCGSKKSDGSGAGTAAGSGSASGAVAAAAGSDAIGAASAAASSSVAVPAVLRTELGVDGPDAPTLVPPGGAARLAVITADDRVAIYRIEGGTMAKASEAALPIAGDTTVDFTVWRTPTELVFLFSDGSLASFDGTTVTRIARPAASVFEVPPAGAGEDKLARDDGLIATAAGEVWLEHCRWGIASDDDPCTVHVYARVVPPSPTRALEPPEAADGAGAGLPLPDGWTYRIQATGEREHGALDCSGPRGGAVIEPPAGSAGFSIDDATVYSALPPILDVNAWTSGLDDVAPAPRLVAGCRLAGVRPRFVAAGPSGYWAIGTAAAAGQEADLLVAWHGRAIAALPDVTSVLFAP